MPEYPTIVKERRTVPNLHPIEEASYRVAIIGEAPGEEEENHRRPFVGKSGQFLDIIMQEVGLKRTACLLGNVCQVRPPGNNIEAFKNGPEIAAGIEQLQADLLQFNPNICILLGGTPLNVARPNSKITAWRGSLFRSTNPGPFLGRKCIAALHPAYVLREFSGYPLLKFDMARGAAEGLTPDLVLPKRELITTWSAEELCYLMDNWPAGQRCSLDIEGGLPISLVNEKAKKKKQDGQVRYGWPCVSICGSPTRSFTIVWNRYSEDGHMQVLRSFARLMGRTDVPKVLQNQLYDNFVLSFGYGIPIRNVAEDVMIKGWEVYAELPRSLSVQASIWTRQPHWKDDTMYSGGEGLFKGCALDSAVTLEICNAQDGVLNGPSRLHYRKIIDIQNPFLYMELRGMKLDQEAANAKIKETQTELEVVGESINKIAGTELRGEKGSLSSQRLSKSLYETLRYPAQYKKEAGKRTESLTTDIEAILNLKKHKPDDQFLSDILRHRHLEGVRETLQITPDADGRVRCAYSLEAETGRVRCYTSPTGSGANMQTIQAALRINYRADEGKDFFQCDLEGADGWTVAAYSAKLGDSTMWDDYAAGMKPAKIIALLYWFGENINRMERSDIKWLHDNVFPLVKSEAGEWLYLGCKRVQHGSSYLMGIPTMCLNILKDSFKESGKPIFLDQGIARALQTRGMFARYPGVLTWHKWAEAELVAKGKLTTPSGHTRMFFGRRWGRELHDTVKEFLAHEPQMNTTWATNLAALALWQDPENRVGAYVGQGSDKRIESAYKLGATREEVQWLVSRTDYGALYIEPLHQVHDALCGQWWQAVRDWSRKKVRQFFNNSLCIAGRDLVIPFDGAYGPSWYEAKVNKEGSNKI